ncbi:acyl-CoA dehydrogenase family protein [Zavarzinia compransoris]|uniref:Flavin-dependent monooxygenase n=1 Tax=Zavarzinia compransoris TaxID=1264899 RepID=A0A317EA88_9PROT|nr:acyl-CoA dehydrogenase family protein [Zavarzinia compransoris]PWR22213.1 flavin-dependent monooxygenase [Zavarzinia compransoris]TDP47033.1 3-hydroxy-9,10-secoandrosta-1,3,5(10)-triene-9,17-dione monooxygenase [Zavarzinia compransoris]
MDGSSDIGTTVPSEDEIRARARALVPFLRERAEAAQAARRLPVETVAAMQEAGLFRVLQPKRWGGYEMHPNVYYDVLMTLGEGDMSAAWCYGVIGCHPWQLALFDDRAARDVWGDDPSVLVSSTYMIQGDARPVEGGFIFNGRWRFSSGCEHCGWVFLGGEVGLGSGNMDMRTFLLPRSDYEIVDTWQSFGLRGTGSHDIVVRDAFVPDYRTHSFMDGLMCNSPGNLVNTNPIYRMPFAQLFSRAVSTAAIGALQAMVDEFVKYGAKRVTVTGNKTAEDPYAQLALAEAVAAIDEMKLVLHRNVDVMHDQAVRGEFTTIEDRMRYRFQSSSVLERTTNLAQRLFKAGGGAAVFDRLPFGRIYADLMTGKAHAANQADTIGRNWGGTMLGLPSTDHFC